MTTATEAPVKLFAVAHEPEAKKPYIVRTSEHEYRYARKGSADKMIIVLNKAGFRLDTTGATRPTPLTSPAIPAEGRYTYYDRVCRDWPMYLDGQFVGAARTETGANTTLDTLVDEIARHTRATTADMAADAAEAEEAFNAPTPARCRGYGRACDQPATQFVAITRQLDQAGTRLMPETLAYCDECMAARGRDEADQNSNVAPARTVDELRAELDAVTDAIQARKAVGAGYSNLSTMRSAIIAELDAAHKHRAGICHCGSRATTPNSRLCPYHAAIERVSGEAIPYAALGEDPEEDEDTDEQGNPADEDVYAPVPVSRPGACRACGGAHHIQTCGEVRAALLSYDKGAGTGGNPTITIAMPSEETIPDYIVRKSAEERARIRAVCEAADEAAGDTAALTQMAADDPCADVRARLEQMIGFCKRVLSTWDGWDDADMETFHIELGQVVGDIREALGRETTDARSTGRNIRRLCGDALVAPKDESSAPDNSDLPF